MNSGKVYCIVGGKLAMVPADLVNKIQKKEQLVARAAKLQEYVESETQNPSNLGFEVGMAELNQIMAKIIRINRQIPPVVQFVGE